MCYNGEVDLRGGFGSGYRFMLESMIIRDVIHIDMWSFFLIYLGSRGDNNEFA